MRRTPLLFLAGALALGEAACLAFPSAAALWPWVLGATVAVLLFGYGLDLPGWGYLATALLGFAVAGSHLDGRRNRMDLASLRRGPFVCETTLRDVPRVRGGWFSADVSAAGLELRVVVPTNACACTPSVGDVWRFAGWLERKGVTDFSRRKLWVRGAGTSAVRVRAAEPWSAAVVCARIRADFARRLGLGLDASPDAANLNRAILLGSREGIDRGTRQAFAAAGTTHVFAISGLHVMCVAGVLFAMLILVGIPVRLSGLVLAPLLWGYVVLVGAAPSAVRAAAMATLVVLAPVFWRRPDALVAWSFVFLAVHLVNPLQLVQVGSMLSFAVMLTLILFDRWYHEVVPSCRGETLAISVAAWAAGVPIVAVVFGRFTPGAVLANLVLLPAAGVSVFMSVLAIAASFLSTALAGFLNNAAALTTRAMVGVSRLVAAVPGCSAEIAPWTPGECAAWYFVLIALLYLVRSVVLRRRKAL